MAFDYLIAVLLFSAEKVDMQVVQLTPTKKQEQTSFSNVQAESDKFLGALQKLSKQSKKFRVCVVLEDADAESPLSEAIRPLLLDKPDEYPAIYTSFTNVRKHAGTNDASAVSSREALSYCFGTIPKALP
jgi:CHASE2 domain-containing sensor protein